MTGLQIVAYLVMCAYAAACGVVFYIAVGGYLHARAQRGKR
jgi:hypothetical protein